MHTHIIILRLYSPLRVKAYQPTAGLIVHRSEISSDQCRGDVFSTSIPPAFTRLTEPRIKPLVSCVQSRDGNEDKITIVSCCNCLK